MSSKTPAEKRSALETHLGQELQMVAEAAVRIRSGRCGHVENVLFAEAMLVHVRLLANFLYGKIEKLDRDVQRTNFAVEWTQLPTSDTDYVDTHYPGIDKHLAHLSWTRVTQGTPAWPLDLAKTPKPRIGI